MDVLDRRSRRRRKPSDKFTGGQQGFFDRVYALVTRIPYGKVATYGQIARMLEAPGAARIVGWAMHDNPHGSRVPCHRVIQQGGTCSPNFQIGDPDAQRRLLEREGVQFLLGGRVDLEAHQWRPELGTARSRRRRENLRDPSQKRRPSKDRPASVDAGRGKSLQVGGALGLRPQVCPHAEADEPQ